MLLILKKTKKNTARVVVIQFPNSPAIRQINRLLICCFLIGTMRWLSNQLWSWKNKPVLFWFASWSDFELAPAPVKHKHRNSSWWTWGNWMTLINHREDLIVFREIAKGILQVFAKMVQVLRYDSAIYSVLICITLQQCLCWPHCL